VLGIGATSFFVAFESDQTTKKEDNKKDIAKSPPEGNTQKIHIQTKKRQKANGF